jgi:hypothetical protein
MKDNTLPSILVLIALIILIAYGINKDKSERPIVAITNAKYEIKTRTIDSLTNVIDSLQTEIFVIEDGCDFKEHRYEDIIFEYELGISYLKDYHPKAYKDFHRIIGMKERYSEELNKENSKRLNQYKNE